jgi:hypothetical protein
MCFINVELLQNWIIYIGCSAIPATVLLLLLLILVSFLHPYTKTPAVYFQDLVFFSKSETPAVQTHSVIKHGLIMLLVWWWNLNSDGPGPVLLYPVDSESFFILYSTSIKPWCSNGYWLIPESLSCWYNYFSILTWVKQKNSPYCILGLHRWQNFRLLMKLLI